MTAITCVDHALYNRIDRYNARMSQCIWGDVPLWETGALEFAYYDTGLQWS